MTHVVTESCVKCKYTDCVDVCPVDCFHEGSNFLAIDPDECIDCALCVAECPVAAIFAEDDLPKSQQEFLRAGPVCLDSFSTEIGGALRGSVIHGDGGRRSV